VNYSLTRLDYDRLSVVNPGDQLLTFDETPLPYPGYPHNSVPVTLQSGVSSLAHALDVQEPMARESPPLSCTDIPVLDSAHGYMFGASESRAAMNASQIPTTPLAVRAADPSPVHQADRPVTPVSSATLPCASVPAQNGPAAIPPQACTVVLSPLEFDSNTFLRPRKVSSPPLRPCIPKVCRIIRS
jgi:hypothetical protein